MRRNWLATIAGFLSLLTVEAQGYEVPLDTATNMTEPSIRCEASGNAWRQGGMDASGSEPVAREPMWTTEPWFTCRMTHAFNDANGERKHSVPRARFEFYPVDGEDSVGVVERLWWTSLSDGVSRVDDQPSVVKPVMGGLLGSATGGLFGVFLGGAAGAYLVGGHEGDGQAGGEAFLGLFLGAALGLIAGEPWGAACGIHMANDRRGHAPTGMAVSVMIFVAGAVAALATQDARLLIAIPVLQVATIVPIERLTAKSEPQAYSVCPDFGSERQGYSEWR